MANEFADNCADAFHSACSQSITFPPRCSIATINSSIHLHFPIQIARRNINFPLNGLSNFETLERWLELRPFAAELNCRLTRVLCNRPLDKSDCVCRRHWSRESHTQQTEKKRKREFWLRNVLCVFSALDSRTVCSDPFRVRDARHESGGRCRSRVNRRWVLCEPSSAHAEEQQLISDGSTADT